MSNRLADIFQKLVILIVMLMPFQTVWGQEASRRDSIRVLPYVGLKTNLLYDAAYFPNIELEMTLGRHWSIMAECTGIDELDEYDGEATQLLSAGIEGRYWFSSKHRDADSGLRQWEPLHGFFAGVYYNMGAYDLERDFKGCADLHPWSAGLSLGYNFHLSRSLRLETSLGVGYFYSSYRHYHQQKFADSYKNYLVEHYQSRLNWIGPTKAKISIVWIPQLTTKGDRR